MGVRVDAFDGLEQDGSPVWPGVLPPPGWLFHAAGRPALLLPVQLRADVGGHSGCGSWKGMARSHRAGKTTLTGQISTNPEGDIFACQSSAGAVAEYLRPPVRRILYGAVEATGSPRVLMGWMQPVQRWRRWPSAAVGEHVCGLQSQDDSCRSMDWTEVEAGWPRLSAACRPDPVQQTLSRRGQASPAWLTATAEIRRSFATAG